MPPHEVRLNGEPVDMCVAAYALWNGGPGYVVYHPRDVRGLIYLNPEGRIASAIRVGMVRVSRIDRINSGLTSCDR